ncbi:MAG TPA: ice-binding family protein [Acidimicrobiales bacterium]|nr:ice-binding family protein [Acidimicrobiales bacterium]
MALPELIIGALAVAVGVTIYRRYFSTSRGLHRRSRGFSGTRLGLGTVGVGLLSFATLMAFSAQPAVAATTVNLGTASTYAVLAGSTITNTGTTVINGDLGLSPGTAITGFSSATVNGHQNLANAASLQAQTDATNAEVAAAGDAATGPITAGALGGGAPLTPGVYNSASSVLLTGPLTLDAGGNPNAVFIFQVGSALTTATGSSVVLTGGAQAGCVFWQVGSSATLGTTTAFQGTILAVTSITLDTGATVQGGLLAQSGAVTLDANTVTVPSSCAAVAPTTTTTVAPTTTTTVAPTTTTAPPVITSTTVVPVGAPATGFGGTAGGSSPLGLIGLGALAVAAGAVTVAVRARRNRDGSSGDHTRGL